MQENWKTMEHEEDGDTNCGWCTWNNPQRVDIETRNSLDLEIRGQGYTNQTIVFYRSARILIRVLENCCHSNSSDKLSANADGKKTLKGVK